jgi:hypothetical protein
MSAKKNVRSALILGALAVALAACETIPTSSVATPSGPAAIPSTPLDLGDWRRATAEATLAQFQQTVSSRYGAGLPISAVTADLRGNDFNCAAPRASTDGRGDPPAQVCRKTVSISGCTHTWQAHLFDANNDARLARARALYDRRCGGDGLLGGPS